MRLRTPLAIALVAGVALAACGSDDSSTDGTGAPDESSDTTTAGSTTPQVPSDDSEVVAGEADRAHELERT